MIVRSHLIACALAALLFGLMPSASADQTDPRLDTLFEELRTGGALNADENTGRILEIWADAQSDTVDLLYQRALDQYRSGETEAAARLLIYVRSLSPNFMQGYALSGFVRLSIDDNAGAIADFSKALELEPRQFEVRKALAGLLLSAGAERDAYEMYQKGLEWNPHDELMRNEARRLRRLFEGQEI